MAFDLETLLSFNGNSARKSSCFLCKSHQSLVYANCASNSLWTSLQVFFTLRVGFLLFSALKTKYCKISWSYIHKLKRNNSGKVYFRFKSETKPLWAAPRSATCFSRTHIAQLIADKSDQVESGLNPRAGELRHNWNFFFSFILASRRGWSSILFLTYSTYLPGL